MHDKKLLSTIGETTAYAQIYLEQQMDYLQLEVSKRIARTTANLVTLAVVGFLVTLVILFLSIAIGFILGKWLSSYGLAFLILTGIYLVLTLLIFFFRKNVIANPISSLIIKNILD